MKNKSEHIIFTNAPITEALIDIQVSFQSPPSLSTFESFHEALKGSLPVKEARHVVKSSTRFVKGVPQQTIPDEPYIDGYRFRSPESNKILQCRQDGFTFNKLKPYENWEVFRTEANEYWKLFIEKVAPVKVNRLGLRYINRIELPLPFIDFKEYLLSAPEVAPKLPQSLSHFFMSFSIPYPEHGAMAIITQTMENQTLPAKLPIILDIDVFQDVNFKPEDSGIWERLDLLRNIKNDIFSNSLTDKAKEMFK